MKIKHIIYLIVLTLTVSSCGKWLDITPRGEVEATDLLTNAKGYNSTLDGIYYTLSSDSLYGKDLSFGMMDVLAKYWDLSTKKSNKYYNQSNYEYKDPNAVKRFNQIWEVMYQGIGQANLILESIEKNRSEIKYSELIEGEAYALRAFMHMELAAMYGPVIKSSSDLEKPCIAYRTKFDNVALTFESMRSILTKAKADLEKAMELLKNDPILINGRRMDGNVSILEYHSVLQRRGARMNYFAAKALTMRAELALLNKSEASRIAIELIKTFESNKLFTFTKLTIDFPNINCGPEMLLSFYRNDLWKVTHNLFGINYGSSSDNFCISTSYFKTIQNEIYGRSPDGGGTDYRLNVWFEKSTGDISYYNLCKFREATDLNDSVLPYDQEVAIVKLSELYYTVCEANIGIDNTLAMKYLNDVREVRNLPRMEQPMTDDLVKEYLLREMRKEYIGEGRMFPTYKRMNTSFYVKQGVIIAPSDDKFVFPIPDDEYEFSPNEKPTNPQK